MKALTKWTLLVSIILVSLWAVGQAPVVNEILPWIADNERVVWQTAQPLDLFQRVGISQPWLPYDEMHVKSSDGFDFSGAARPQISANGRWLVFHDKDGHIRVWDLLEKTEQQLIINWKDEIPPPNGDNSREPPPNLTPPSGVFPAISGSGRIIAFLSQDPNLNDPDGNGAGNPADSPPPGYWLIYIHDRDFPVSGSQQGESGYDEILVGATRTIFLPNQARDRPLFVRLTEVRLSLDQTGAALAFSAFTGSQWELWFVQDVQSPNPQRIAYSNTPFSVPTVAGSKLAFTASGPFSWGAISLPTSLPGVYVIDMTNISQSFVIQTNGVNGAPVLSRDVKLLAFHSTMTAYRVNNGSWIPLINKRNAVDDVFVFNLSGSLVWSTLQVRGLGTPPITLFDPCVNPALPSSVNSSVNVIAFQQIVNGQSRVRVVSGNNVLR